MDRFPIADFKKIEQPYNNDHTHELFIHKTRKEILEIILDSDKIKLDFEKNEKNYTWKGNVIVTWKEHELYFNIIDLIYKGEFND